jgi:hypothetical protein
MSKQLVIFFLILLLTAASHSASAQCSICTRTAQQLGERPARALNKGIIYLAFTPLAIFFVIGYRWAKSEGYGWWKSDQHHE